MDAFIYHDLETREDHFRYSAPDDKELSRVGKGLIKLYKITNVPTGPTYKYSSGAWVSATYTSLTGYYQLTDGTFVVRVGKNNGNSFPSFEVQDADKEWQPISEL